MTAEVFVLPGVERRDILGVNLASEEVLRFAIEQGVTDVVVIGRDRHGEQYVASSLADCDRAVGMLMRAATFLARVTVVRAAVVETAAPSPGDDEA
jgi:hypothetical protein